MKKTGFPTLLSLLFICQFALAQEVNVRIMEGFKNGDAAQIAAFLSPMVDYIGPKKRGSSVHLKPTLNCHPFLHRIG